MRRLLVLGSYNLVWARDDVVLVLDSRDMGCAGDDVVSVLRPCGLWCAENDAVVVVVVGIVPNELGGDEAVAGVAVLRYGVSGESCAYWCWCPVV